MCKSCLAWNLSARTYMIHYGIGNHWIGMVGMKYYLQPVWHYILFVTDFKLVGLRLWRLCTCCTDHHKGRKDKDLKEETDLVHGLRFLVMKYYKYCKTDKLKHLKSNDYSKIKQILIR